MISYLKINTNRNNTIIEVSEDSFSGMTKGGEVYNYLGEYETQIESKFNFPTSQPFYYYRWNGTDVVPNDTITINSFSEYDITGKDFKVYDYLRNMEILTTYIPPYDIDYNILGLNKKRVFDKGELGQIDYYGAVDSGGTFQDLVLTEYRTYYRKDRMVYKRDLTIEWYLVDGEIGATKTTQKYYSTEESLKLGERRRRNIISNMKINTIGLIQMINGATQAEASIEGMEFLASITPEISLFIEGVEESLKSKILLNETFDWLDYEIPNTGGVTVRYYLLDGINIDYSDV